MCIRAKGSTTNECSESTASWSLQQPKVSSLVVMSLTPHTHTPHTHTPHTLYTHTHTHYRQGARFVEVWVDGFAFSELVHRQEELTQQRDEIDKQRKIISKRKPSVSTGGNKGKSDDGFTRPSTPR